VHGFNTVKIVVILVANYALARGLGGTRGLWVATWGFNVGVLFLNEWYDGYRFGDIHDFAAPLVKPPPLYTRSLLSFLCCGRLTMRTLLEGLCIDGRFCLISPRYD
jgi:protein-cysteine N-palmitoyltransferase HHAT